MLQHSIRFLRYLHPSKPRPFHYMLAVDQPGKTDRYALLENNLPPHVFYSDSVFPPPTPLPLFLPLVTTSPYPLIFHSHRFFPLPSLPTIFLTLLPFPFPFFHSPSPSPPSLILPLFFYPPPLPPRFLFFFLSHVLSFSFPPPLPQLPSLLLLLSSAFTTPPSFPVASFHPL